MPISATQRAGRYSFQAGDESHIVADVEGKLDIGPGHSLLEERFAEERRVAAIAAAERNPVGTRGGDDDQAGKALGLGPGGGRRGARGELLDPMPPMNLQRPERDG